MSGFELGSKVTLRAEMIDDANVRWESHGTFRVNDDGTVDLGSANPISGTYEDINPMGLFWSMSPVSEEHRYSIFERQSLEPVSVVFSAKVQNKSIATAQLERRFIATGIERIPVKESDLRGVVFRPPGPGPFSGIVSLSGSGGGLNENQAALLASHGHVVFALAYFNYEDLPKDLESIPLEYFGRALDWLAAREFVMGDRLAVTGRSRGGELVLLLGSMFPRIKVVVAYVPSGLLWSGFTRDGRDVAAWTYRGESLPYVMDRVSAEMKMEIFKEEPYVVTPYFHACLEHCEDLDAATIPVETINGSVLLVSGRDDQMWPSSMFSNWVMNRFEEKNFAHSYQHLSYEDAGHMITIPNLPSTVTQIRHPLSGQVFELGGTPKGNAYASSDSWTKVLQFLDSNLKHPGDQ
jgi:dienelactone hydrolase